MKVLKFPKDKMTKPRWWLKIRNMDKSQILNRIFSFACLILGIALVGFIVYKMNHP